MHLFHFYHQHHLKRSSHSKFWQFELAIWFHVFARSMIAVFVPIIMLKNGYTLNQVMMFYFFFVAIDIPLNFLAGKIIRAIGAKKTMILSTFAVIAFFYLLNQIPNPTINYLLILSLVSALYDALYWVSHIYLFLESEAPDDDSGEDTSSLSIVKQLGMLFGPAIGALILLIFNQTALITTSIIFFALSLIPLLLLQSINDRPQNNIVNLQTLLATQRQKRNYFSILFYGIHHAAELVIWPLFIYTIFQSIESVAYVPMIISITAMIFSYFIGKKIKQGKTRLIIFGSIVITAIWIARIFIENSSFYYISIFLVGIFSLLVSLPLDSDLFEKKETIDNLSISIYRNLFSMFPRLFLYGALALAVNIFHLTFITAAASIFLLMAINSLFFVYNQKNS